MPNDPSRPLPSECQPVALPTDIWRCSFADALASGASNEHFTGICVGSGQTVSQSAGNLNITAGVNINEETIIRSVRTFSGAHLARWKATLSQRVANQAFIVELADLIQDNAAFTINSTTSVTVTITTRNPQTNQPWFSANNVGQTVALGNIRSAAGVQLVTTPSQDAVIASVSGNAVTFTVAGYPASGIGTLMVYGWNNYRATYDGATATNMKWEPRRRGYQTTAATFTCTTTASPGHFVESRTDGTNAALHDVSGTLTGTSTLVCRSVRLDNLPDDGVEMYLFIRAYNGTVSPTATTFTVGFAGVERCGNGKLTMLQPQGDAGTTSITGSVVVTQATGSSLNAQVTGTAAQGATASGNPVFTGGVAKTAQPTARTDGQIVAPLFDKIGRLVTVNNHVRDLTDLNAMVTLTTTTETTIVGAIAATFNDIDALILTNTSATGTRVDFRTVTAGTVVFSVWLPATTTLTIDVSSLLKQATVNTAWTAQLSVAVTDVRITAVSVRSI